MKRETAGGEEKRRLRTFGSVPRERGGGFTVEEEEGTHLGTKASRDKAIFGAFPSTGMGLFEASLGETTIGGKEEKKREDIRKNRKQKSIKENRKSKTKKEYEIQFPKNDTSIKRVFRSFLPWNF